MVRAATWSQVPQPFRKPAWSGLSKPSTVGEILYQVFQRLSPWPFSRSLGWNGYRSHDSGEEFGQPGASFGAQVLQEFHADVVVTWGCCWFRLVQSSWNLLFSEWMRKILVWHLLQKSSALHTDMEFKLLVMRCLSNLDEMSGNGISQNTDIFNDLEQPLTQFSLMLNISDGTTYRHNFNRILLGTYTRPIQQCHLEWPWVTLSDLAKYSMTWSVLRSLKQLLYDSVVCVCIGSGMRLGCSSDVDVGRCNMKSSWRGWLAQLWGGVCWDML